jgi:hypothetical protein
MNLFVGVLFSNFTEAINKENKKGIQDNDNAQRYLDYLRQIDLVNPDHDQFKKKTSKIQLFFSKITNFKYFDSGIMITILLNLVTIAIEYEGSSNAYSDVLNYFNYVFTAIFIIECCLKLLANGIKRYFYVAWNIFDFIVVVSSIVDLVISNALGSNVSFIKSLQIIRVLRVMRVTR